MSSRSSMLHVRVDEETKALATEALSSIGLSVSDAVRLFLHRVVIAQEFPLELKIPSKETRAAMAEARAMLAARKARFKSAKDLLDDLETSSKK